MYRRSGKLTIQPDERINDWLISDPLEPTNGRGTQVSTSIYTIPNEKSIDANVTNNKNIATVCKALPYHNYHPRLNKTIHRNGQEHPYDHAKYYNYFPVELTSLHDLAALVKSLLSKPHCCLIRGLPKDPTKTNQLRRYKDEEATIYEEPMNWFALDIDSSQLHATGNLQHDLMLVLNAISQQELNCFAIASSGYYRKPGLHMRIFAWASTPVSCLDLKKHFMHNKAGIDLALFHPIQPIYTARPTFLHYTDPITTKFTWSPGFVSSMDIEHQPLATYGQENEYSKSAAEAIRNKFVRTIAYTNHGSRHIALYDGARLMGKLVAQNLLNEEESIQCLRQATLMWESRDEKRDMTTISDGMKAGKDAITF